MGVIYRFMVLIIISVVMASNCLDDDSTSPLDENRIVGEWRVIAIEKTGDQIQYLDPADSLFIFFVEIGVLRGQSHGLCGNNFNGRYELGPENSFRVDSLITTEAACPQSMYFTILDALGNVTNIKLNATLYLYYNDLSSRIWLQREE